MRRGRRGAARDATQGGESVHSNNGDVCAYGRRWVSLARLGAYVNPYLPYELRLLSPCSQEGPWDTFRASMRDQLTEAEWGYVERGDGDRDKRLRFQVLW